MPYFGPIPGAQAVAWDGAAQLLGLTVGKFTEFGLYGGGTYHGPASTDLDITALDPAVVTVHELPTSNGSGWRRLRLLALKQGTTVIRASLSQTTQIQASMSVEASGIGDLRLVFYPGERLENNSILGAIYVIGGKGERFSAAGGPESRSKQGAHNVTPTPPGIYTLGPQMHHTTTGWPRSVIPFGAALRFGASGEVEYAADPNKGGWRVATGPSGTVTNAVENSLRAQKSHHPRREIIEAVRDIFVDLRTGLLRAQAYYLNDFGRWSWNLRRKGVPTAFYIHTTPDDERDTVDNKAIKLAKSHGCVHIVPEQRDQMISAGYLKEGVTFEVRSYSERADP